MSRWRLRALIVGPVLILVFGITIASCGGGGGCGGTFDAFGNFIPGACPSPRPGPGFSLESIAVYSGPAPTFTPTPTPNRSLTATPTVTGTATPLATTTAVPVPSPAGSGPLPFHATGNFVSPSGGKNAKHDFVDITNDSTTLWTSDNPDALQAPAGGTGGVYNPIAPGCACVNVSSGGISGNPVGVTVFATSTATPNCGECPTPQPTPTSTPKAAAAEAAWMRAAARPPGRVQGILQWSFDAVMPLRGNIAADNDGRVYFLTLDGVLHALSPRGRERWRRPSAGSGVAIGSDGGVFALEQDHSLVALTPSGKPNWTSATRSRRGPLAASLDEVYLQSGGQLMAIIAPGSVHWQVPVSAEVVSAALAPDGTLVAGIKGGPVIAVSSNGVRRWTFTPKGGFAGAVAIRDGQVFVGSMSGAVYSLATGSGMEQWHFATPAMVIAGPAANSSGPVFFESDALYGLGADGEATWSRQLGRDGRGSLSVDGGGVFASTGENASLVNSDGTYKWNTRSFGEVTTSTVSPIGTLYVATRAGHIYAVK